MADGLAALFAEDNPRFATRRIMAACGIGGWSMVVRSFSVTMRVIIACILLGGPNRCAACNAPGDVQSTDDPCHAWGAPFVSRAG